MKMDDDADQATYLKLESIVAGSGASKIVLNNTPLVICSENGVPSHYMPCVENGQIVLRKIVSSGVSRLEVIKTETDCVVEVIKVGNDQLIEVIKTEADEIEDVIKTEVEQIVDGIKVENDQIVEQTRTNSDETVEVIKVKNDQFVEQFKTNSDEIVQVIKLKNDQIIEQIEANSDETVQELNEEMKEPVILNSLISLPKKKLSYETTFIPAAPLTKGVNKGIIRYGSKHLIIDQHIMIPPREFKRQINNTEDLVTNLELAPCSKQQMHRMLSGFTRMFAYPAHKMPNTKLLQLYNSNCISRKQENIIEVEEMDDLPANCAVPFDFNNMRGLSWKRKCSDSESVLKRKCSDNENVLKTKCETTNSKDSVLSEFYTAANSASLDHKYSKQLESSTILNNSDTKYSKQLESSTKLNISNTKTAKQEELIISDSLSDSDETFMIIDDTDANISQNNLEILLAAASESNQIVTICDEDDIRFSKRIIIVANDKIEQILGSEY